MTIIKKSGEELINQAEWFLDYAERKWKITAQKKDEIISVLNDDSVDISDKGELKKKLNWVVSENEFDWLYWDYVDYNRSTILEIRDYFNSINFFPIGYEFLVDDLALTCVREWTPRDVIKEDLLENLSEYQKCIKNNIDFLEEKIWVDDKDLWKFIIFIVDLGIDYDSLEKNFNAFKSEWKNSAKDLAELCMLFSRDNICDIINLFVEAWIKTAADFLRLKELLDPCYFKNLKLFIDAWIKTVDDLLKLKELIKLQNNECTKIIKVFKDIWVKTADDFLKLSVFIESPYYFENLKLFIDAWIKTVDDLLELKNLILIPAFSEKQKSVILLLLRFWITSPGDLLKLGKIIFDWDEKKIWLFINSWFKTVESILQLSSLITTYDYCYENIKLFIDAWINTIHELLELTPFYYNWTIENIKIFIDLWIKTDDFMKLNSLIKYWNSKILLILKDMWIRKVDDFLALRDICIKSEFIENLEILKGLKWLRSDNIVKFKYIIINWDPRILRLFVDAWANDINHFLKIEEYFDKNVGNASNNVDNASDNIKSLNEFWILDIDELLELIDCIFSNHYILLKKLEILKLAKVTPKDAIKLSWYLSWKDFDNFLWELDKIYEKTGIKFDDSLFELSDYSKEIWDYYWYWYDYQLQRNLLYFYYNKWYSINDMRSFEGLLQSDPDVLLCILDKYKDISLCELERIQDVLKYSRLSCLKMVFQYYPSITPDELLYLKDILTVNSQNLRIILEKYPSLSQDDLLSLLDILQDANNDNLRIIFEKYPEADINSLLWLKVVLCNASPKNFEIILNCFEINLDDLIKYPNILKYSGKFPEILQFKEDNRRWYLKYLDDVAATTYDKSKKCWMMQKIVSLSFVEAENYLKILNMFDESISTDVQRIKSELIDEILNSDNPEDIADQINNIFEKNNLPLTWKIFKVFELLYPKEKFKETLQSHWSPVLHQYLDEGKNVYALIYKDLVNIAIKSGDRSLREYIKTFIWCEGILKKFEWIVVEEWFDKLDKFCLEWKLTEDEQEKLLYLFRRISVLYTRYYWKKINVWDWTENIKYWDVDVSDVKLVELYNEIKKWFHVRKWKSVYDVLQRFLIWLWYNSFNEVLEKMNISKKYAHERWLQLYNNSDWWKIIFPECAFLKWVWMDAFQKIINRWITSREYLWWWEGWMSAWSDCTPFDIDWWYVDSFKAWDYGNINLVVDTKKWNMFDTRENGTTWYTENQYELFKTWYLWSDHYWIRTWLPMTEVDYIIYNWDFTKKEFEDMCYEIARNGYYIPITDEEWNIKFTPEMYHKIRRWFNYMKYYDWFDVELKDWKYISKETDNEVHRDLSDSELWKLISENSPSNERYKEFARENRELAENTIEWIRRILKEKCWIKFNSKYDGSITWAQLYDSWSTWRWTDIPTKDVDLDFTLLLDAKDYKRVDEISKIIHKEIWTKKNGDHWVVEWWNQIKSKINNIWKSKDRPDWVPLDLLILKKSQVIDYSSSDAMKEKLNYIASNPETWAKDLDRVRTNVIIMKKLLKAKWCYKKPEWWIAWIWVENRITQNHWSFVEALESFEQVAYWWRYKEWKMPIPLVEFKELYPMYDAWENYKDWCNDNFVYKLEETGYNWTLEIIKSYRLEWIEGIRKLIKEYEAKKTSFIQ